jgi:hypothetical protein
MTLARSIAVRQNTTERLLGFLEILAALRSASAMQRWHWLRALRRRQDCAEIQIVRGTTYPLARANAVLAL